jgi:hypothetical protein
MTRIDIEALATVTGGGAISRCKAGSTYAKEVVAPKYEMDGLETKMEAGRRCWEAMTHPRALATKVAERYMVDRPMSAIYKMRHRNSE